MATGWRPAQNHSLVPRDGSRRLQLGAWLCQLGSADCTHTTATSLRYPRLLLPGFGTPGWALCQDTDISGGCLVLLHPRVGASMGGLQSGLGDPAMAPRVSCGQLLGHAGFASSPGSAACLLPSPRRGKLWLCNLLRGLDPFLQLVSGSRGGTHRGAAHKGSAFPSILIIITGGTAEQLCSARESLVLIRKIRGKLCPSPGLLENSPSPMLKRCQSLQSRQLVSLACKVEKPWKQRALQPCQSALS